MCTLVFQLPSPCFALVLEAGGIGIDELAFAGDQHDRASQLTVVNVLLERIVDPVELLL